MSTVLLWGGREEGFHSVHCTQISHWTLESDWKADFRDTLLSGAQEWEFFCFTFDFCTISLLVTSKAFNFDRVFMKLYIFLGDPPPPLKKSTGRIKSRSVECQNQNSDFEFHRISQLNFSGMSKLPAELLTSTGTFMFQRSCHPEKSV
jgi:hypothetical protein